MAHVVPKREPCRKCNNPVFLAERLVINQSLYHRTCFRCARCNTVLSVGYFYETEKDHEYCCEQCPDEEKPAGPKIESNRLSIAQKIALFERESSSVLKKSLSDEEKSKSLSRQSPANSGAFNSFLATQITEAKPESDDDEKTVGSSGSDSDDDDSIPPISDKKLTISDHKISVATKELTRGKDTEAIAKVAETHSESHDVGKRQKDIAQVFVDDKKVHNDEIDIDDIEMEFDKLVEEAEKSVSIDVTDKKMKEVKKVVEFKEVKEEEKVKIEEKSSEIISEIPRIEVREASVTRSDEGIDEVEASFEILDSPPELPIAPEPSSDPAESPPTQEPSTDPAPISASPEPSPAVIKPSQDTHDTPQTPPETFQAISIPEASLDKILQPDDKLQTDESSHEVMKSSPVELPDKPENLEIEAESEKIIETKAHEESQELFELSLKSNEAENLTELSQDDANYPDDLNPFGDDEEPPKASQPKKRPSLNPFGSGSEDDEEKENASATSARYSGTLPKPPRPPLPKAMTLKSSTNPFGSDDEEDEGQKTATAYRTPVPTPRKPLL